MEAHSRNVRFVSADKSGAAVKPQLSIESCVKDTGKRAASKDVKGLEPQYRTTNFLLFLTFNEES